MLTGDVGWDEIRAVMAICLGFRLVRKDSLDSTPGQTLPSTHGGVQDLQLAQDPSVSPPGWEGLVSVPDVADTADTALRDRLSADLPEDERDTGECIDICACACFSHR